MASTASSASKKRDALRCAYKSDEIARVINHRVLNAFQLTTTNKDALFEGGIYMLSGTILVATVDTHVRRTIQDALVAEGHCVVEAVGRNDALQSLPNERPDVVLIDFDSEQERCLDLCREMRRVSDVPILVVAAQHCERDKVDALDAGADDCMIKPLAMRELLARIRAVLRRKSARRKHPIFVSDDLTIDLERRTVCVAGKVMRLTPKEHELLRLLVENQGKPLKHRRLLQAVWGSQCGSQSEHLRVLVCQLRKKVEVNPRHPKFICTDPWFGYYFAPHGLGDLQPSNAEG
jgi:two-component system, OmpR family, KDP operon response regulator KdpE